MHQCNIILLLHCMVVSATWLAVPRQEVSLRSDPLQILSSSNLEKIQWSFDRHHSTAVMPTTPSNTTQHKNSFSDRNNLLNPHTRSIWREVLFEMEKQTLRRLKVNWLSRLFRSSIILRNIKRLKVKENQETRTLISRHNLFSHFPFPPNTVLSKDTPKWWMKPHSFLSMRSKFSHQASRRRTRRCTSWRQYWGSVWPHVWWVLGKELDSSPL